MTSTVAGVRAETRGPGAVRGRLSLERVGRALFDSPLGPSLGAGIIAVGTVYIATHNPHVPGALGYCPLYSATGLWCPGCGCSRAVYDLAHGDVAGAFAMNPIFTIAVPLLAILWVRWLLFTVGRPTKPWNVPTWAYVAFTAVVTTFAVLRNVPMFAPYLAP